VRFLHKPYDPMLLYETLADLLGAPAPWPGGAPT